MAPGVLQDLGMDEAGLHRLRVPGYIAVGAYDTSHPPGGTLNSRLTIFSGSLPNVLPGDVDHEVFGNECTQGDATSFLKHVSMLRAWTATQSTPKLPRLKPSFSPPRSVAD